MRRLRCKNNEFEIDLSLRGKCTIICGDSATGKTFVYELLQDTEDLKDVYFINFNSVKGTENFNAAVDYIKTHRDKIIVIDQADDVQDVSDEIMYAINTDYNRNTYIVIGRAPKLVYRMQDVAELRMQDNKFTLNYLCPEPIF